jgi:hypothetical protein
LASFAYTPMKSGEIMIFGRLNISDKWFIYSWFLRKNTEPRLESTVLLENCFNRTSDKVGIPWDFFGRIVKPFLEKFFSSFSLVSILF